MKKVLVFLAPVFLCLSCSTTRQSTTAPAQPIPARFDYSPPSRTKAGAANMTVALIKPAFVGNEHTEYYTPPFNDMAASMAGDFQELLTAKGFTIRGPFKARDEMTYNEKMNSDFALEVHIILSPLYVLNYTPVTNWGNILTTQNSTNYIASGTATLTGYLEINARSSQYGELLWKKRIDLEPAVFDFKGKTRWSGRPNITEQLRTDVEVYNAFARGLEKYYAQAMNLSWQQIDPDEMKTIADQSKKADKKGN